MKTLCLVTRGCALLACALASVAAGAQAAAPTRNTEKQAVAQRDLSAALQLASDAKYKQALVLLEKANAESPATFAILFNLGQVYLRLDEVDKAERTLRAAECLSLQPEAKAATLYLLAQADAKESRPLDALDALVQARRLAPQNVDVLYSMAEISMANKYFEDAIPLLQEAAAIAPQRSDVQAALGVCYLKAGKAESSIEVFRKLTQHRNVVEDHAYLGAALATLGRFAEAKQEFEAGLKLDPANSFCLFQLGYIARKQGDPATAEAFFKRALHAQPDYPAALLEMANLRVEAKQYAEARALLLRYVAISSSAATGYYKLAMVERKLGDETAAGHDLQEFQRLSAEQTDAVHPYDHLLDYVDSRSRLTDSARVEQDVATLEQEIKLRPEQAEISYALTDAYLKSAMVAKARQTVAEFDRLHADDARVLTGLGVLLCRHGMYDDGIGQFELALHAKPEADDARFDLATAYLRKGDYATAQQTAEAIGDAGRKDESYTTLIADIDAHVGQTAEAEELYKSALVRNPDNDQTYLSLALLELQQNQVEAARQTLQQEQKRVPGSGKIYWGLGLAAVLDGDAAAAGDDLERAVDLMPEWPGSYSVLGFFYFETGQVTKAREVLERFRSKGAPGGLDLQRIESALDGATDHPIQDDEKLGTKERAQVFQLAEYMAEKTL